jgi:hypothetical protein
LKKILSFSLFEASYTNSYYGEYPLEEICDKYLPKSKRWISMRDSIVGSGKIISIEPMEEDYYEGDSYFSGNDSTDKRIVIRLSEAGDENEFRGSLAHETVHGLQFLSEGPSILLNNFVDGVKSEFSNLSDVIEWSYFMLCIYFLNPNEREAWEAQSYFERPQTYEDLIEFIEDFSDPDEFEKFINYLLENEMVKNDYIDNFSEFPNLWIESYKYDAQTWGYSLDPIIMATEGKDFNFFMKYYLDKFQSDLLPWMKKMQSLPLIN